MNIDFVALISFAIVTTFTPGPNSITCASMGGLSLHSAFLVGIAGQFHFLLISALAFALNAFAAISSWTMFGAAIRK